MLETALKNAHVALGARLVPFAGWNMPVQYGGILDEARTVRTKAGLFDLGHMGRVRLRGRDAEALLQKVQTNDAAAIPPGRIRYALLLDANGLTRDDVLVYRNQANDGFFVVVNASNTQRDLDIFRAAAASLGDVTIEDVTRKTGMVAIQGPMSQAITQQLVEGADVAAIKYYGWIDARVCGEPMQVSRTGYTGEDGFEVYIPSGHEQKVWDAFLQAGESFGIAPIGLGARDTLRHEAGMPLYGHEIDETTNPLEAGLDWAVKWNHEFTGKQALEKVRAAGGTHRKLVGLVTASKRCPRQGYEIRARGERIGHVCSGNISPTLDTNIATAYVREEFAAPGTQLEFVVKDKTEPCTVATLPFYQRKR